MYDASNSSAEDIDSYAHPVYTARVGARKHYVSTRVRSDIAYVPSSHRYREHGPQVFLGTIPTHPSANTHPCTEQIGANAHNTKPGRERHGLISIDHHDDMQAWANDHIRIALTPSLDTAPLAPNALGTVHSTVTLNIFTRRISTK